MAKSTTWQNPHRAKITTCPKPHRAKITTCPKSQQKIEFFLEFLI
jgi:hypothetical protein